jgi:hypothetical protein
MKHLVNTYTVEYIMDLVIEQNKRLLKVISEEEFIPYGELVKLIPKHSDIISYISESSSSSSLEDE